MVFARFMGLFVFAGGAVGGATTSLLLMVWSLWTSISGGYFNPSSLGALVPSFVMISLLGILVGFPAAAATGSIYAASQRVRRYRSVALIGGMTSLVWAAIFTMALSSGRFDRGAFYFIACFVVSGVVAALVCHRIAQSSPGP